MVDQICNWCGLSREMVRDNHPETCPEAPPEERPTEWVDSHGVNA